MATSLSEAGALPPSAICDWRRSRSARVSSSEVDRRAEFGSRAREGLRQLAQLRLRTCHVEALGGFRPLSAPPLGFELASRRFKGRRALRHLPRRALEERLDRGKPFLRLLELEAQARPVGFARRMPRRHFGSAQLGIGFLDLALRLQLAELRKPRLAHPDAALQLFEPLEMSLALGLERGILHMMAVMDSASARRAPPAGPDVPLRARGCARARRCAPPRRPYARAAAARWHRPKRLGRL